MRTLTQVLEDTDIKRLAPSVFAETSWHENSDRYRFLPTINVVNALRDKGFVVTRAQQSRTSILWKEGYTKHMLRLRHRDYMNVDNVGDELPELILVNSHDRSSMYKLMFGIFRLACLNGIVVSSSTIDSLNIRHVGQQDLLDNVIDVSAKVVEETPKVFGQINRFKAITLNPEEQMALATSVREIIPTTLDVPADELLRARRTSDKPYDIDKNLWLTSNVIQENVCRGGVIGRSAKGKTRRTQEIKNVKNDININKAIWKLTEEMARIKSS